MRKAHERFSQLETLRDIRVRTRRFWFSFDCVYKALPHIQIHFSSFINHTHCPALFWPLGFRDVGLESCVNSRLECMKRSSDTADDINTIDVIARLSICFHVTKR